MSILKSLPSHQYFLGCLYCSEGPLFCFTYVDRQTSFISAQEFYYPTDPLLCAISIALMCGFMNSPEDIDASVQAPDSLYAAEPPRKRLHSSQRLPMIPEFKDVFEEVWQPSSPHIQQICACKELDVVWYADGSPGYLKLAWEVGPSRMLEIAEAGNRIQRQREVTIVEEMGRKSGKQRIPVVHSTRVDIRQLLSIPVDEQVYSCTRKRSPLVDIPLASLSLRNQLFLIWLFLTNTQGLFYFDILNG
jgi:hypothetical protein